MDYTEIHIRLHKVSLFADILISKLNKIDFESYVEDKSEQQVSKLGYSKNKNTWKIVHLERR